MKDETSSHVQRGAERTEEVGVPRTSTHWTGLKTTSSPDFRSSGSRTWIQVGKNHLGAKPNTESECQGMAGRNPIDALSE